MGEGNLRRVPRGGLAFLLGTMVLISSGCGRREADQEDSTPVMPVMEDAAGVVPLGLVARIWPSDNPYTKEKAELGRLLYYDKRLSADNTVACASCHHPDFGFTDGQPTSVGIRGQRGGRSAPTVINRAYSVEQFWDGRAPTMCAECSERGDSPH